MASHLNTNYLKTVWTICHVPNCTLLGTHLESGSACVKRLGPSVWRYFNTFRSQIFRRAAARSRREFNSHRGRRRDETRTVLSFRVGRCELSITSGWITCHVNYYNHVSSVAQNYKSLCWSSITSICCKLYKTQIHNKSNYWTSSLDVRRRTNSFHISVLLSVDYRSDFCRATTHFKVRYRCYRKSAWSSSLSPVSWDLGTTRRTDGR